MRNVSHRSHRGNKNIHFMSNNFFSKTVVLYEIRWKNTVQSDMPQFTVWRVIDNSTLQYAGLLIIPQFTVCRVIDNSLTHIIKPVQLMAKRIVSCDLQVERETLQGF
jgi:hypothetical protein